MKLRCIHSCMVLTVVGLLVFYSAFLTSPSYVDSTLDGGEASGVFSINSSLIQSKLLDSAIADAAGASFTLTEPLPLSIDTKAYSQPDNQNLQNAPPALFVPEVSKFIAKAEEISKPNIPVKSPNVPQHNLAKDAVWTRDLYESGFAYPNPTTCPNDGQGIRLVMLISSAPGHFSSRDAIRLTWGHYAQRLDVAIAFIIGKTDNDTILEGIEMEKHLYDDLIVANFVDSYNNLTLKTMASLEWIDTYCNQSEYVLKTDDDMFINVPNLLNFINKIQGEDGKQPKLYGRLARKWKPVRNKKSKYYISFSQYRKTVYPDFTTGPAYLFNTRLVRPLLEKGLEKTYLKLEDVYTTGIVAEELKIKRVNIPEFANKKVNFHKTGFCALSRLISMHMVAYHEQFELWKKILDGRTKCKIIYTTAAKANNANNKSPAPQGSSSAVVTVTNSSSSSSNVAGTTNNANIIANDASVK